MTATMDTPAAAATTAAAPTKEMREAPATVATPGSPAAVLARLDAALDELGAAVEALPVAGFNPLTLSWAGHRAARGRACLDRLDATLARRAKSLSAAGRVRDATSVLDPAGQRPAADVAAATRRADTIDALPTLEAAFTDGDLPAGHLDVIARARRALRGELRAAFDARHDELVGAAGSQSLRRFAQTVRSLVDRLHAEHGGDLPARLRRKRSLRRWFDDDGMRHWHLTSHPEAAAHLDGALDAQIEALFHRDRDGDPNLARTSEQLGHDALCDLVAGGHAATRPGKAGIVVHVDIDTLRSGLHERSVHIDNNGQQLPPDVIRRLACDAGIVPVVLSGDTMPLDVGRASRTATPAQRTALAALYSTCAISDCPVPFAHTQIHHTVEWDDDGFTDLQLLLPVCDRHHHLVHDDGWRMTLDADRTLRLYRPDGTLDSVHPPPGLPPPRGEPR